MKIYTIKILVLILMLNLNLFTNWEPINIGYTNLSIIKLASKDSNVYASTKLGLFISDDLGNTWKQKTDTLNNYIISSFAFIGDKIFAGAQSVYSYNGIYSSIDKGLTWQNINEEMKFKYGVSTLTTKDNQLYIGTVSSGVYVTRDQGKTYVDMNNNIFSLGKDLDGDICYPTFTSFGIKHNYVYAATSYGLYISNFVGFNWRYYQEYFPKDMFISTIIVNDKSTFLGLNNGVFKSTDEGKSWKLVGLNNMIVNDLMVIGNTILAGTKENGIFKSTDDGLTWVEAGLKAYGISTLTSNSKYVFAGTTRDGVFRIPLSEFNNTNVEDNNITNYISIYPNPCSDNVKIKFNNELSENEEITIIDNSGKNIFSQNIKVKDTEIKLLHFQSGIYYAKFKNRNDILKFEVIK